MEVFDHTNETSILPGDVFKHCGSYYLMSAEYGKAVDLRTGSILTAKAIGDRVKVHGHVEITGRA